MIDFQRYVSYTTLTLDNFLEAIPNYDPYIKFDGQKGCLSNTYFYTDFLKVVLKYRASL